MKGKWQLTFRQAAPAAEYDWIVVAHRASGDDLYFGELCFAIMCGEARARGGEARRNFRQLERLVSRRSLSDRERKPLRRQSIRIRQMPHWFRSDSILAERQVA